jgi:hypothetical protein
MSTDGRACLKPFALRSLQNDLARCDDLKHFFIRISTVLALEH